jgi:CRISPR/Cas system-associated exonuclease Cas4 (RecB family)
METKLQEPIVLSTFRIVRTLTNFADYLLTHSNGSLENLLRSPFSNVDEIEAKAICAVTESSKSVAETIAKQRVIFSQETSDHATTFIAACEKSRSVEKEINASLVGQFLEFLFATNTAKNLTEQEISALQTIEALLLQSNASILEQQTTLQGIIKNDLQVTNIIENVEIRAVDVYEKEVVRDVKRRKTPLSASALNAYAECPRKWYYRYVCQSVEDKGSSASTYGTAMHLALELFHRHYPKYELQDPELLLETLTTYLHESFEKHHSDLGTKLEYMLQVRRAERTIRHYIEWFISQSVQEPFDIVGNETSLNLFLHEDGTFAEKAAAEGERQTFHFIGYIDRLDKNTYKQVTVIDYKTGSIAENAEDYRRKVKKGLEYQLPLYYWAQTAAGDNVTKIALVPLKDQNATIRPIALEVVPRGPSLRYSDEATGRIGVDELLDARKRMAKLAYEIQKSAITAFPVAEKPDSCVFCSYKAACRDKPPQEEERFGR